MKSRANLRKNFPILSRKIDGHPLIYFDNASTTQKPKAVIRIMSEYYSNHNANIHRGIHTLSQEATEMYEAVRDQVTRFINAKYREEIIFTSGTTEGINAVAQTIGKLLKPGDEIITSELEHHSNIVPWQQLSKQLKFKLNFVPITTEGRIDLNGYRSIINKRTKLVAFSHASNVLGTINPVVDIISIAHRAGAMTLIDAAQSAAHLPINVQKLGCDFLVFSGHKLYGPTGIGVLYGRKEILQKLPPYKFGGHMIARVTKDQTTFADLPYRFEAGTAPIAEVIGLGEAIRFVQHLGFSAIKTIEDDLCAEMLEQINSVPGLRLLGPAESAWRLPIFSFTLAGVPPHDIATLLDRSGIAVRSGHHCAQPLHEKFGLSASTRASLTFYNTKQQIGIFIQRLKNIRTLFKTA